MNLHKLAEERAKAECDKAELFEFYHQNWDQLFGFVKDLSDCKGSTWHMFAIDYQSDAELRCVNCGVLLKNLLKKNSLHEESVL